MPMLRSSALALLVLLFSGVSRAEAQNCSKDKPCGNSCIAREKVCRVGQGTARWAPGADTVTGVVQQSRNGVVRADTALPRVFDALPPAKRAMCTVSSITDGDTFRCAGGRRVRLLLIDAPERSQRPFGAAATAGLRELVSMGDRVTLEMDIEEKDRYGRTLAYVYVRDGRMVNEEMARRGVVVVSVYPPNVKHVERIRAAVEQARSEKRGLWKTSAFECAPSDHRRGRC